MRATGPRQKGSAGRHLQPASRGLSTLAARWAGPPSRVGSGGHPAGSRRDLASVSPGSEANHPDDKAAAPASSHRGRAGQGRHPWEPLPSSLRRPGGVPGHPWPGLPPPPTPSTSSLPGVSAKRRCSRREGWAGVCPESGGPGPQYPRLMLSRQAGHPGPGNCVFRKGPLWSSQWPSCTRRYSLPLAPTEPQRPAQLGRVPATDHLTTPRLKGAEQGSCSLSPQILPQASLPAGSGASHPGCWGCSLWLYLQE